MESTSSHIEPRVLKGFQDFLPEHQQVRRQIIYTLERIFAVFGFAPLETPAIEPLEVLLGPGGEAVNKEIFRLETPEGEPAGLRFDLTVPFARVVAQYPDRIKLPFRRYAIGSVWRADKPGLGRYRQFVQCDADIAGAVSVAADAEIVALMCAIMRALHIPRYCVLISNRKLLDALLADCGIADTDRHKHVLRVIDKLAKVGLENVKLELGPGRIDESGDPIRGVGLTEEQINRILSLVAIQGDRRVDVIRKVTQFLPDSPLSAEAIGELEEMAETLEALGISETEASFSVSLTRGLDYYTGFVFEMVLPEAPEFGSVMGGGRYNELVLRFSDRKIPCTGMSVGLDRLSSALIHHGVTAQPRMSPYADVMIAQVGAIPKSAVLRVASMLREAGIRVTPYLGLTEQAKLKQQLSLANHYEIPVAVILAEAEWAQGQVLVKDLDLGKQEREGIAERQAYREAGKAGQVTVSLSEVVATVKTRLAERGHAAGLPWHA